MISMYFINKWDFYLTPARNPSLSVDWESSLFFFEVNVKVEDEI